MKTKNRNLLLLALLLLAAFILANLVIASFYENKGKPNKYEQGYGK